MTLVSILIPAFNAEQWLAATVESALRQTWKNIEIVIVDDGSSDGTLHIAKNFESTKVQVISQQNRGAAAARNRALAESRGSVIQYLDADDLLAPEKIERQIPMLEARVLCSGQCSTFFRDPSQARVGQSGLSRDFEPVDFLVTAWVNGLMMQPGAWLLTRELALQAGAWDERLSVDDDGEYFTRVILASEGIRFCPDALVNYRVGNLGSLSWQLSPNAIESSFLAATLSTEHLLNAETSDRTRRAAAQKLMAFVYATYPKAPDLRCKAEERIRSLGVESPHPLGGRLFRAASRILGWKVVKGLRRRYYIAKLSVAKTVERLRN